MAVPTTKAPEINAFLNSLIGKDRVKTITSNKCVTCMGNADTFTDDLSKREYSISGMCQICQDKVFGGK
jgi:hypothetical protein|tara:strand:- start:1014 stop:1220 length:207 start_codon:yes stop_codon:yes gene_type:complete